MKAFAATLAVTLLAACSLPSIHGSRSAASTIPGLVRGAWPVSQVSRYEMRVESKSPDWGGKPLDAIVTGVATVTVVALEPNGNAKVQLLLNLDGPNDKQNPLDYELLIGTDGEVLSDLGGQAYLLLEVFPIFPLLPAKPARSGGVWQQHYSLPNPVTDGAVEFDTHATYESDDVQSGTKVAVVKVHLLGAIDWRTTMGRLWGPSPPSYTADTVLHDVGSATVDDTFSYDAAHHVLTRSATTEQWNFVRTYIDPVTKKALDHQPTQETQIIEFTRT